jgi:hypothetical protein
MCFGSPDQVLDISEQAYQELKEYERFFDQIRRQKTQVSALSDSDHAFPK